MDHRSPSGGNAGTTRRTCGHSAARRWTWPLRRHGQRLGFADHDHAGRHETDGRVRVLCARRHAAAAQVRLRAGRHRNEKLRHDGPRHPDAGLEDRMGRREAAHLDHSHLGRPWRKTAGGDRHADAVARITNIAGGGDNAKRRPRRAGDERAHHIQEALW